MATPTNRLENLKSLQAANYDVAFSTAFSTLVGGSFLVGFIQYLDGSDFLISLSAALPSLIGLLQIPGGIWGRSFPYFRKFVAPGGWIWRLMHSPLIFLPLLAMPDGVRLFILFACIGVATTATQLVNPIYNDWIGELVPPNARGWYFSRRTLISTATGVLLGLAGGVILDQFRNTSSENVGFSIVFGLGLLCALTSMFFFLKMKDIERPNPINLSLKQGIKLTGLPFKDRNFRKVLVFSFIFVASQGFAGPLYAAFALETLNMPFTTLQVLGLAHAATTILCVRMWGYFQDRYGAKPILMMSVIGTIFAPIIWALTKPGEANLTYNTVILLVGHLYNGFVWAAAGAAQLSLYMATSPQEDRPNYLAGALAVQSIAMGLSPLAGSTLLYFLRPDLGPEWAYKTVFLGVCVIRVASMLSLIPIKETGAQSFRIAVKQISRIRPSGMRALKEMSMSGGEAEREAAVEKVGRAGLSMATADILRALSDPSPRVRRQAARSLAVLSTPEAGEALLIHIVEHPELAEEEALEALGELRPPDSAQALIRYLQDPRSVLRRTAARTLGRLGDRQAVPALMEAAREPGDHDLCRASIQALRVLEATEAEDIFADALTDQHPSIRTAAAEAVSELHLVSLAPVLRQAMSMHGDETASEMAYALGAVGDEGDLPTILSCAQSQESIALRRRCLMGAARLVGLESQHYRLTYLEGVSLDLELMKLMRPLIRREARYQAVMDRYAQDEMEALRLLAELTDKPGVRQLAETPVEEAFLLAVLLAAGQSRA